MCLAYFSKYAAKILSHVFHHSNQFVYDFNRCVYAYNDKDDWLLALQQMLDIYNFKDDK